MNALNFFESLGVQENINSLNNLFTDYIDFTEPMFLLSIFYSILCFLLWILIPHLEFKYKFLSRLLNGDQEKACDFLSYFLIYTGTMRNNAINEMINKNKVITYGIYEIPLQIFAYTTMTFGIILVIFSFYRLGLRGMYFGDHFGFLLKEKIVSFPYNYFPNAQYVGTTWLFIGYAIAFHSPAGLFITLLINILYQILNLVESKKLEIFYPYNPNNNKENGQIKTE
jgi:methylene-fatty-acyl-phospholipid synthase